MPTLREITYSIGGDFKVDKRKYKAITPLAEKESKGNNVIHIKHFFEHSFFWIGLDPTAKFR